jgi:hypothetical protein
MVCRKTTWAGCGAHVAQVMSVVPPERRCVCNGDTKVDQSAGTPSEGSVWGAIKKAIGGPGR